MKTLFILLALITPAAMAGVMPATTRVIYPQGEREKTLMLVNANDYPVIAQTWVDNGEGSPDADGMPFVILPPVFRLAAGAMQGLRIIYNHDPLPQDRESVFWLNLYEVPPDAPANGTPHLRLAMNTQLKIFYRPQGITITPEEAIGKLTFTQSSNGKDSVIEFHNPTPLNISLTTISVTGHSGQINARQQNDMMIKAYSNKRYPLSGEAGNEVIKVDATYLSDNGETLKYSFMK